MSFLFFFNDTATTEIYTLSLHDALPISVDVQALVGNAQLALAVQGLGGEGLVEFPQVDVLDRSEEHTSELQSHLNLVCRLLLEKKKQTTNAQSPALHPPHQTHTVLTKCH